MSQPSEPDVLPEIHCYTDGGCAPTNPGPGGWGAVIWEIDGPFRLELCGGEPETTNNRMELTAVIRALRAISPRSRVTVFSDSSYVCNLWGVKRIERGEAGQKNHDLWLQLREALSLHEVEFTWVKGHSGVRGNEMADRLADRGRMGERL